MEILKIKDSIQEIAEAISSILFTEVTIVDNNLIRVAATGIHKKDVGNKLPSGCSYDYILKNKKSEIIIDRDLNERCLNCNALNSCDEAATIGFPILTKEKQCLGVIGIIAFNKEQRDYIYAHLKNIKTFLNKISSLIAGNLKYEDTMHSLKLKNKETINIVNSIDYGILLTDEDLNITEFNSKAIKMIKSSKKNILGLNIKNIFKDIEISDFQNEQVVRLNIKSKGERFLIKIIPTKIDNIIVSFIIRISNYKKAIESAYKIIENHYNTTFDDILGNSISIKNTISLAKQVSKTDSTVMIRGESGTGKELFARSIHNFSNRNKYPFVAINCASIPENLLESEFFGYEKGAFSGASESGKLGRFELANNGTLFLDEIGDLQIHLQAKLLRVLQDGTFTRLGGKENIKINFRLITATNRNLEEMLEEKTFREDLYYRLNVIPITIPPLRERREDIPYIAIKLLNKFCNKFNKDEKYFSEDTLDILKNNYWQGNIRELENVVEFLVNMSKEKIITEDLLPLKYKNTLNKEVMDSNTTKNFNTSFENKKLKYILEDYEKKVLENFLKKYGKSTKAKKEIAKTLGIDLSTLYRKLYRFNLE